MHARSRLVLVLFLVAHAARAAPTPTPSGLAPPRVEGLDWWRPSVAVNLGLIQPILLGGANLEVDVRWRYLVVSYSHGWNLKLEGSNLVGDQRAQNLTLRVPYTTGLGVGATYYIRRMRSFVDLRLEVKFHRFEVSYATSDGTAVPVTSYNTYTLGAGAYFTAVPFATWRGPLRGLNVSLSVRYWPNLASTLPGGAVRYENRYTGREETHTSSNIGIANTPFIVNVSIGYVFQ